jgi:hypothetical protein
MVIDTEIDEYRIGRPFVIKGNGLYQMFYSSGGRAHGYRLAYAESADGLNWTRKEAGIGVSASGWDSEMMAYPSVVTTGANTFLFYNGNDYGRDGFGYAVLDAGAR